MTQGFNNQNWSMNSETLTIINETYLVLTATRLASFPKAIIYSPFLSIIHFATPISYRWCVETIPIFFKLGKLWTMMSLRNKRNFFIHLEEILSCSLIRMADFFRANKILLTHLWTRITSYSCFAHPFENDKSVIGVQFFVFESH